MFKRFVSLQWKSFVRSSSFGKSLGIKIFMVFMGLYLIGSLALFGGLLYPLLRKLDPHQGPIWTLSHYLVYWVLAELMFRYFMQKLPVMDIRPMLVNNIPKSRIVNYILGRSAVSGFNLFVVALFLPFAVVLLIKGYPALHVLPWLASMVLLGLCINYLNFLINKNDTIFALIVGVLAVFFALDYFGLVPIKEFFAPVFHALYAYPATGLVPLGILMVLYWANFGQLKKGLYLDRTLKGRTSEAKTSELAWTRRFGSIAPFLQLDMKLIWRNKRTKMQVFISLAMVLYGLIFYGMDSYGPTSIIYMFVGIFITGIFLSNFGQFIPAWDSEYYSMLMAQNIPLRKYLESKAGLITVSIGVMFLLSIPYVYFGWKALAINLSAALYNLGVNIPVVLWFGSLNKKRINLTKSAFGNMQGTSATQFLLLLPLMMVPMLIYGALKFLVSFEVAIAVVSILGIIGLFLRNTLLDRVTEAYRKRKYRMVAGFKEKNG
ncbi:MAG: DUF5687 family protein [Flavobacteriaceae bacterium]